MKITIGDWSIYRVALLSLTLGSVFTGILMNQFSERFNAFKLPVVGTSIVSSATFFSLTCYLTHFLPLCYISAFLWGSSFNFTQSNIGALISKVFPGKVEAYSVFSIVNSFGSFAILWLEVILSSDLIFLLIIAVIQVGMTGVAKQIK